MNAWWQKTLPRGAEPLRPRGSNMNWQPRASARAITSLGRYWSSRPARRITA